MKEMEKRSRARGYYTTVAVYIHAALNFMIRRLTGNLLPYRDPHLRTLLCKMTSAAREIAHQSNKFAQRCRRKLNTLTR